MSGSAVAAATGGFTGSCGVLAHAPSTSAAMHDNERDRNADDEEDGLGWVFLEIGVALVVAVLIVWWTLPRKPRDGKADDER